MNTILSRLVQPDDGRYTRWIKIRHIIRNNHTMRKNSSREQALKAGYARADLTPALNTPLSGRPTLRPRLSKSVHDPLYVRALFIRCGERQLAIAAADILLVTKRLHEAVARAAGIPPRDLLLFATHTHSGPGGYWRGPLIEGFMGKYCRETFEGLTSAIAGAVRESAGAVEAARLTTASVEIPEANTSRRTTGDMTDPVLTLLQFETKKHRPILLLSFGAHPIAGLERKSRMVTADYPGEICRRLERKGYRPVFLQGAGAGTNPGWMDIHFEQHLARMGEALEKGVREALAGLSPVKGVGLAVHAIPLQIQQSPSRIFPEGMPIGALFEGLASRLRARIDSMTDEGLADNRRLSLNVARLGRLALFTVPAEIGPRVSMGIRDALAASGFENTLVASMCNGYMGYVHCRSDYRFSRGLRILSLYENAMSSAGRDMGDAIIAAARAYGFGRGGRRFDAKSGKKPNRSVK